METFEEDLNYLLQHVMQTNHTVSELFSPLKGANITIEGVDVTSQSVTWLDQMPAIEIQDNFRQVLPDTLQKFLKLTDLDSRMFGYEARKGWTP